MELHYPKQREPYGAAGPPARGPVPGPRYYRQTLRLPRATAARPPSRYPEAAPPSAHKYYCLGLGLLLAALIVLPLGEWPARFPVLYFPAWVPLSAPTVAAAAFQGESADLDSAGRAMVVDVDATASPGPDRPEGDSQPEVGREPVASPDKALFPSGTVVAAAIPTATPAPALPTPALPTPSAPASAPTASASPVDPAQPTPSVAPAEAVAPAPAPGLPAGWTPGTADDETVDALLARIAPWAGSRTEPVPAPLGLRPRAAAVQPKAAAPDPEAVGDDGDEDSVLQDDAGEPEWDGIEETEAYGEAMDMLSQWPAGATADDTDESVLDGADAGAAFAGTRIVLLAARFLGLPYVWGGHALSGFDCSGFTWYVYRLMGISIPLHDLAGQMRSGPAVAPSSLKAGDLVFFVNTYKPGLSHAGIYIGKGLFIDAADEMHGITLSDLTDGYWASRYLGATRPW